MNSVKESRIHEIRPQKGSLTLLGERPNFLAAAVLTMQTSGAMVRWFVNKFILWKKAIEAKALLIVEKELALFISDCNKGQP